MAYYCTECEKTHRNLSGIGQRHEEYKGEPPTVISVKPDRSVTGRTRMTVTGFSDEYKEYTPPPTTFTESLIDDLRDHANKFPQVPWNYTPQKLDTARVAQQKWLGELKKILVMG